MADIPPDPHPRIPPPPTREELDEISRDQALITDEWAPNPEPTPKPETPTPP